MNFRKICTVLLQHEYSFANSSNPQYTFMYKQKDTAFKAVVLINNIDYSESTDPLIFDSIKESLEKTFLLRGMRTVNVLFIIFTKNPFAFKKFADSDFTYWVSDMNTYRLISFSDKDQDFSELREPIENSLSLDSNDDFDYATNVPKEKRLKNIPFFTYLLLLLNIGIFFAVNQFMPVDKLFPTFMRFGNIWERVLYDSEYYRLVSCAFLHFNFDHLINNMLSLVAIGYYFEPAIGHFKFIFLYIASTLAASLGSVFYNYYFENAVISAGASGAIFGIFGAYAIYTIFRPTDNKNFSYGRVFLISILMLYNGVITESVDNAAHFGGFIIGTIISFIYCICKRNKI